MSAMDFEAARVKMVDNQIRTTDVTSHEILRAFLQVPREEFLPASRRPLAYLDDDIPLGDGRFVMEPSPLAKLLQLAGVGKDDVVLDVGCNTGYSSAILSHLAGSVVALEEDPALAAAATDNLARLDYVTCAVVENPLVEGCRAEAPYDVIIFQGAVETLPIRTASCEAITCFNAVHHFELARFASEAARVLSPAGFLVLYTRTAKQNRDTIWGRFFPEFATLETRLHSASELQEALDATHAFVSVRMQMIPWSVTTSLSRLLEQVTAYHYSTFRFYSSDRLRAARDTFQCRLRDVFGDCSRITFSNDHLLVVAQRAGRSPIVRT